MIRYAIVVAGVVWVAMRILTIAGMCLQQIWILLRALPSLIRAAWSQSELEKYKRQLAADRNDRILHPEEYLGRAD